MKDNFLVLQSFFNLFPQPHQYCNSSLHSPDSRECHGPLLNTNYILGMMRHGVRDFLGFHSSSGEELVKEFMSPGLAITALCCVPQGLHYLSDSSILNLVSSR